MYQLNNRRTEDFNIFVMNDKLMSCKSRTAIRRQTHNVTPVCGWRIPPCFTVHHHFLLIRIQRESNIIWLLDKNRPKFFTFCEGKKTNRQWWLQLSQQDSQSVLPSNYFFYYSPVCFVQVHILYLHFVIANKRKGICTPPQCNGNINNKK